MGASGGRGRTPQQPQSINLPKIQKEAVPAPQQKKEELSRSLTPLPLGEGGTAIWERAKVVLRTDKPGANVMRYLDCWEKLQGKDLAQNGLMPHWINEKEGKEFCSNNRIIQLQKTMKMSTELEQELWKTCVKDEEANIITRVPEENVKWSCPAWVIPKKKEGTAEVTYRRVQDCRRINDLLIDIPFQMEDTRTILDLAKPGLFATSLDFKSAYNLFPIETDSEATTVINPENFVYYHCFKVKQTWWKPRGMLFGAKHAPYYFTIIMRPVMKEIRRRWRTDVVIYLDDMLILHENQNYSLKTTLEIAQFLLSLGIILSVEKCEPIPKRIIKFLGWEWNFETFALKMTQERRRSLMKEVKIWMRRAIEQEEVLIKTLQELVGKLQFLKPQLTRILLYLRPFYDMIAKGIAITGQRGRVKINPSLLGSLRWIDKELFYNTPRKLLQTPPQGILTTDASESGCGATLMIDQMEYFMLERFNRNLPPPKSSNQRELLAVHRALLHFRPIIMEQNINTLTLESDNMTTVYNVLKIKSAKGPLKIVRALFSTLTAMNLTLTPLYRPGINNEKADALSRLEWMGDYEIKWEVVEKVLDLWKIQPTIDLFATKESYKLPAYCSANKTDHAAQWIDVWTQPWEGWK
jgi:hypothetical protein